MSIIDLDDIVRKLQAPGSPVVKAIDAAFPGCVSAEGVLDREALGLRVFADANDRRRLNRLMKGPIAAALFAALAKHWLRGTAVVVLDAPLLFETPPLARLCAIHVVVAAPTDVQIDRVVARDDVDRDAARQRVDAQMPLEAKIKRAHVVIDNAGDLDHLDDQCRRALPMLWRRWGLWWFASAPGAVVLLALGATLLRAAAY
mmetsp:Transcript_10412/g.26448  ORF Transcript_10412/g.26448 Transcript_10412/m.26448 type:complete len:202 (+) Transcript_10412:84-689(+)